MGSWCTPILTSGGVVLSESGDTSLTCGFPFVEGGYEDGRPMEMGEWLQLDVLLKKSKKPTIFNNESGALGWQVKPTKMCSWVVTSHQYGISALVSPWKPVVKSQNVGLFLRLVHLKWFKYNFFSFPPSYFDSSSHCYVSGTHYLDNSDLKMQRFCLQVQVGDHLCHMVIWNATITFQMW